LRYVNLDGTVSALDYTVTDKYLEIGTSKDAMFSLLDALSGNSSMSIMSSDKYSKLFSLWGALPVSRDVIFGMLKTSDFQDLFPIDLAENSFPFGISFQPTNDGNSVVLKGIIPLSSGSLSDTLTSPSPSEVPVSQ
jgi:hypothetical protein